MHLHNNTLLQGGKYKIERFIASGGFGCTYEAHHTLLDLRVALKEFFVSDFCNRDEKTGQVTVGTQSKIALYGKLKKKFLDEARALYKMKHPGIVRVIDVFEENGTAYYAMDYIEGQSLSDILKRRGTLPEAEAVGYIRQVAEALKYVHSLNRLHLDIKPGNIMLDKEGRAVLIDFGASKHYDEETGENTSSLLGINTKGYAPVEQVNQSFKSFCPATDIYALGATLYKLLTGITPPPSTALQAEEATLAPLPSGISPSTRHVVESAMQLLRRNRPQTVEDWVSMLGSNNTEPLPQIEDEKTEPADNGMPHSAPRPVRLKPTAPKPHAKVKRLKWIYLSAAASVIIGMLLWLFFKPNTISNEDLSTSGSINDHEYVDLGLSVKWATCNVGASSPSDYGDYFAWGETTNKSSYDEDNCETYDMNIEDIAGNAQYDAARANWGSTWRLPTKEECEELYNNCKWVWTSLNGNKGYLVTSKINGNSIFLPAPGYRYGTSHNNGGEYGDYWSSTPDESDTRGAYGLYVSSSYHRVDWNDRSLGRSVRPVLDFKEQLREEVIQLACQRNLRACERHEGWRKAFNQEERIIISAVTNPDQYNKHLNATGQALLMETKSIPLTNWDDIRSVYNEIAGIVKNHQYRKHK